MATEAMEAGDGAPAMRIGVLRVKRVTAGRRTRGTIAGLLMMIAAALTPGGAPAAAAEAPGAEPEQVALIQSAPAASGAAIAPSNEGHAKYRLSAATYFDEYSGEGAWIEAHVDVIKAYPPFGDVYVQYHKPVIGYHDPATQGYAPLNQPETEAFVEKVKRDMGLGYAGVFVDDANWSFSPSPGPEANLANLMEAIRKAEPGALIEMNSQYHDIWPKIKAGDPYVARALAQVDIVTKEFGVGPHAGITTGQDYAELMTYIDMLAEKGIHVVMGGDKPNRVHTNEYTLATCLLVNDGRDFVNQVNGTPAHFWKGWSVDLGSALGRREQLSGGLWRRRFSGGVVYTLAPGGTTQTIKLGKKMHSAEWGSRESLTLEPEHGAVFAG